MSGNFETRLRALEDSIPRGYEAYDAEGKPTIQSDLPALEWYAKAMDLLNSKGRSAEKQELRTQLEHTVGLDNGGGRFYELLAIQIEGPIEGEEQ